MQSMIKAVFFDIGGTLLIKKKLKQPDYSKLKEMLELLDLDISIDSLVSSIKANEQEYKSWSKKTLTELPLLTRWKKYLRGISQKELDQQTSEKLQYLWGTSKGSPEIDPQTSPTLKGLVERGYKIGTISHTSPRFLESSGVLDLLSTKIHAGTFGKRKPHPSLFLAAARECGLRPEECAYVGDRPSRDVIGSREAGIGLVIVISEEGRIPEKEIVPMKPDLVIQQLSQLLDIFSALDPKMYQVSTPTSDFFLYDAAISTMWGIKKNAPLAEFFSKGRMLNFARFELNHNIPPQAFTELNQNLYHVGSVHDPCPAVISAKELDKRDWLVTSVNETLRVKGVDVIKHTIDQALTLSASNVVIHPGRITGDHSMDAHLRDLYAAGKKGTMEYEDLKTKLIQDRHERAKPHLDSLLKSIRELIDFSRLSGISLGLENRFHYYELPIFEEMEVILDTFTENWVGWHLDIGHLQVFEALGLTTSSRWLEKFGQRIVAVHLHDVKGISDHQSPGSGDVDFVSLSRYLPKYAYRTLEVRPELTESEIRSGMETLVAAGCVSRI